MNFSTNQRSGSKLREPAPTGGPSWRLIVNQSLSSSGLRSISGRLMTATSSYAPRQRVERRRSLLHDYSAQFGRIADRFAAEAALRLGKEQAEPDAKVASAAQAKA